MTDLKLSEITQMNVVKELTRDEAIACNGGESFWYWICYAVGSATRAAGKLVKKHGENCNGGRWLARCIGLQVNDTCPTCQRRGL